MMKQAILITAYKHFDLLESILKVFDEDFEIFIHIDRKVVVDPVVYKRLTSYPTVKLVVQKYKINWGDLNHVKAILLLCREALKSEKVEYIHLISGVDYAVKNINYFKVFLNNTGIRNFWKIFVYRRISGARED